MQRYYLVEDRRGWPPMSQADQDEATDQYVDDKVRTLLAEDEGKWARRPREIPQGRLPLDAGIDDIDAAAVRAAAAPKTTDERTFARDPWMRATPRRRLMRGERD